LLGRVFLLLVDNIVNFATIGRLAASIELVTGLPARR